eukprot:scaffold5307_cov129-Skeletonema_marinoi.AAC.1
MQKVEKNQKSFSFKRWIAEDRRSPVTVHLLPSSSNNYRSSSLPPYYSKLVFLTTAMMPLFRFLIGIALVSTSSLVSNVAVVEASNFSKAHAHTGKVEPFSPGDPKIKLDGKATSILKAGKPYQTQVQSGDGGRGLVIQDVDAPTHVVWDRILDFDNYGSMVPKCFESKNYKIIDHKPTKANNFLEKEIFTRMKHHKALTWTLDYTKESDFDDSCGYWYIAPHPDNPEEKTRLYYSVGVSMFDWVPKFVVDFMSSKALTDATAWVKKFSEIEWAKEVAKGGTSRSSSAGAQVKNKGPLFALPFFGNKKKQEEEERLAREAAEKTAMEAQAALEEKKKLFVVRAGFRRYLLVSLVVVLAAYNINTIVAGGFLKEKSA